MNQKIGRFLGEIVFGLALVFGVWLIFFAAAIL
jgi:hypothetical protein